MNWKTELKILAALVGIFVVAYVLPLGNPKIQQAIQESFRLLQWYARNHTLACVVPALFIAGAIITFLSQASVMRYLGAKANPVVAYAVASVAGCILAVCSCSVLPMFAGIYKLGAGLGPATAFLYSGPAINVLAIFLTARVLGFSLGLGRVIGAVFFSVVIGVLMAAAFRKSEAAKTQAALQMPEPEKPKRSIGKTALFLACMVLFLVFSDWFNPGNVVVKTMDGRQFSAVVIHETRDAVRFQLEQDSELGNGGDKITLAKPEISDMQEQRTWVLAVYHIRWYLSGLMGVAVLIMAWRWFEKDEIRQWMANTWGFTKLLVPLLYGGVFVVGFVSVLLPEKQVAQWVGDNSLRSNLVASVIGAFWYFATLTEIPITQALMNLGMHKGPVLALLLAGPALSLPNMLVIRKVMGTRKLLVFVLLVVVMATITGMFFGTFWG
ncbi:MAG TPA: permease [Sedimentisphaerales bacterium]|nr:permease [Sedimentisphaerales bacterium]